MIQGLSNNFREMLEVGLKKKFRILPVGNWALIRNYHEEERKNEAGIVIPESQLKSQTGIVEEAPEFIIFADGTRLPCPVKKGDVVIYTNFVTEIPDIEKLTGEKDLGLVRIEEIYAVAVPVEDVSLEEGIT